MCLGSSLCIHKVLARNVYSLSGRWGWGQSESDLLYALELHPSFVKLGRHTKHCNKGGEYQSSPASKAIFGKFHLQWEIVYIDPRKNHFNFLNAHMPHLAVLSHTDGLVKIGQRKVPDLSLWDPENWSQQILTWKIVYCAVTAFSLLSWLMMDSFILKMQNASHVSGNKKYVFLGWTLFILFPAIRSTHYDALMHDWTGKYHWNTVF